MRILGVLAVLLALTTACNDEEVDPWDGYSTAERNWLTSQGVEPHTELADASLDWAQSVCKVFKAGGDAGTVFEALDQDGYTGSRKDEKLIGDINVAHEYFCRKD